MNKHSIAQAKYDAKNCVHVSLKLNKTTDKDIISRLAKAKNKQGLVKELLRKGLKSK